MTITLPILSWVMFAVSFAFLCKSIYHFGKLRGIQETREIYRKAGV